MSALLSASKPDLSNCDREPIHIPGFTQSHGTLLACNPETWQITHASANAGALCNAELDDIVGGNLRSILPAGIIRQLEPTASLDADLAGIPVRLFGIALKGYSGLFDIAAHTFDGRRIVEIERASERSREAPLDLVRVMLAKLQQTRSLSALCEETADQLRRLIGYDRVMIYRFLPDGSGQVIAESRIPDLEPLLNLRYPASDVPKQARELYKKNWVRLISDVASEPVPVVALMTESGRALDLSYASLRSVSPVHIEYLRNMGVGASMSISIIVGGELWGLIACHHKTARRVTANVRAAAELLGQVFSLQIQTVEGIEAYVTMRAARALLDRVVAEFPVQDDLITNLASRLEQLAAFMPCDGVAIWIDGVLRGAGMRPTADETKLLTTFVERSRDGGIYATHMLAHSFDLASDWACGVRGVLAVPLSHSSGNYLYFFRKEITQTVRWGGDPSKPATLGDGGRISPRKSFSLWQEEVKGQSLPWTSRERLIGDTLRVYLLDIIVRFSEVINEERRQAAQRQRLLTNELNHRVKGTRELIQSLVVHGYDEPGRVQDFVRTLEGRIRAIALAHDATSVSSGSDVGVMIERTAALHGTLHGQLSVHGPEIKLDPRSYTAMALVMHELMANAVEFGALSAANGRLSVSWFLDGAGRLVLDWEETGGPPPRPAKDGLGIAIIRRNIPHALGGEANVEFDARGLKASFILPARYIVNAPKAQIAAEPRAQLMAPARPLEGYSILVVEDQMPTALDHERHLIERGAAQIRIAGTTDDALALIALDMPDVAVLDVDLGDDTSLAVADALAERSIPFVFTASKADLTEIPPHHRDVHVIEKPCTGEAVVSALKEALLPHLIRAVLTRLI